MPSPRRSLVSWVALVLLLLASPDPLQAHLALSDSSPAAGSRLTVAPTALRLTFTEPFEISLSTLTLRGPDGSPVRLGPLSMDNRDVLAAEILEDLSEGDYYVDWQAVGRDGHPVRGTVAFTIEADAVEIASPDSVAALDPVETPAAPPSDTAAFSSRSPLYAVVRWLMYVGIVGTLGSLGFMMLLRSSTLVTLGDGYRYSAERGAAAFGILALLPLVLSVPLRIQAQSHAVFGAGITQERFAALSSSQWGTAWGVQAMACLLAFVGFLIARRGGRTGWLLVGAAAVGMVITPALSGHAAAVREMRPVAILADTLHVTGAGLWIGTLVALLVVGVPLIPAQSSAERGRGLSVLVTAFSPLAMAAAAMLVATGFISTLFQLTVVGDLWSTSYGRLLSAKLLLVLVVVGLGAFNWKRMRPAMAEPGADARLRRSAGAEVTAALIAIMLTAVLVAVQPPSHEAETASTSSMTPSGY